MISILLLLFVTSLIYVGTAGRLSAYVKLLIFQGFLLFLITYLIDLHEINTLNLIFILLETLVFKSCLIPFFLQYLIKRNKIRRDTEPYLSNFSSLLVITLIITLSFVFSFSIESAVDPLFFAVSISTILTGMFIIATRRKVITHVMGYMILENGIFLLSVIVGSKMPMMINMGILLDIFVSVLVLGIFVNRIGNTFDEADAEKLTALTD